MEFQLTMNNQNLINHNSNSSSKFLLITFVVLMWFSGGCKQAQSSDFVREIIGQHDLSTALAMGKYYLKSEALLAIRQHLSDVGRENDFDNHWRETNHVWQQAELKLLQDIYGPIEEEFGSLRWLYPRWQRLLLTDYKSSELAELSRHLSTEVGIKQAQIIDHYVSLYVMRTLTFSGKLRDISGAEDEKSLMQTLYVKQDGDVFFSVRDSDNAEGQAFALSSLGKKYFADNVIKLVGEFNQYMYELAESIPARINEGKQDIDLILDQFQ